MSQNLRLIEILKPVFAYEPKNYTGASNGTDLYVSMKNYGRFVALIQTGAWAGGTAAVTLLQATAIAGTSSKALAFSNVWINTAALPDTFVKTAVTSNTFNLDTANLIYWIEIDQSDLDQNQTTPFDCLAVHIASPSTNADLYSVTYLLGNARYPQALLPLATID